MVTVFEDLRGYLPPYLTEEEKRSLFSQLTGFPDNIQIYNQFLGDPDAVQADVWRGLVVINWHNGEKKTVTGLILSNSCDISSDNQLDPGQNILFVPLVSLQGYLSLLKQHGRTQAQIEDIERKVRHQKITRILYLPSIGELPESIALLDNVHSQPLEEFFKASRNRVVSLNLYGWYIFLIKISIHFTRIKENIKRDEVAPSH